MRFLIDADLPRALAPLCRSYGHDADDVRDVGLGVSEDKDIAACAQDQKACLVTGDFGFADIRSYPPGQFNGIVVLCPPHNATTPVIESLLRSLLDQPNIVEALPQRLAIVEFGRVRLRPPMSR